MTKNRTPESIALQLSEQITHEKEKHMDVILDFTHTYSEDWIRSHEEMAYIDCTDLGGTDMYCSPDSVMELEKRIAAYPLKGIHFIDSGNYHYMTRLFTKRIHKPYHLVLFDNHTDCKPSMIPELLSCGAWAKQVLEEDEFLQKMIIIGPKQKAIEDIDTKNRGKLVTISWEEIDTVKIENSMRESVMTEKILSGWVEGIMEEKQIRTDFPLYFSIDKDVLAEEYAVTNWDQGEMSLELLKAFLRFFIAECEENNLDILGVDICGELPEKEAAFGEAVRAQEINQRTNEDLCGFCKKYSFSKIS